MELAVSKITVAVKIRRGPSARRVPVVANVRAGQSLSGLRRIRDAEGHLDGAQRLKTQQIHTASVDEERHLADYVVDIVDDS